MQLTLHLALPLLTAATATATTTTPRGITDKIKGAFGNADAMVRELSDCMVACAQTALFDLSAKKCSFGDGGDDRIEVELVDCLCQKDDGNGTAADPGQAWENGVQRCFAPDYLAKKAGRNAGFASFDCRPEGYEEGRMVEICGAIEGKSVEERNATLKVYAERAGAVEDEMWRIKGEKAGVVAGGGNGSPAEGKDSGAAGGAAGPGMVARVAGAALAAAVAYAVAML
ncbi:predicted protein [Chaetomium globosum CBS 148.51]|uniref:Extracellular membrane protein CFEM domain-containing protein n=1 Tax=Chaetomium globosum (strain ATCC 6205 / CBS 148.51 / DSM 1962 / NBRC 6347 / NRRL 1970) TaxID=306901 RepID=Q2GPY8_CHAGB|nr:uncharacterized protein CHGG_09966 [Chaetomium globosum CBS 148.51]EAQ83562.1 predicted protein [Chaetomium globosum CBS 148.51]